VVRSIVDTRRAEGRSRLRQSDIDDVLLAAPVRKEFEHDDSHNSHHLRGRVEIATTQQLREG
jgi:hypothetical protein